MISEREERYQKLKERLPRVVEGVDLSQYSPICIGGPADLFFEVSSAHDLITAATEAQALDIPYFILGSASHVLISDSGFPGLVIKNNINKVAFLPDSSSVIVDSGVSVNRFLNEAAVRDLGGMEMFAGIFGTIGGALYNNLSVEDHIFSEFVEKITLLAPTTVLKHPSLLSVTPEWFEYSHGTSKLRRACSRCNPVILSAKIKMRHRNKEPVLAEMNEYRKKKQGKIPRDKWILGEIFKQQEYVNTIDIKGLKKGALALAKINHNYIINTGSGGAMEAFNLIKEMKKRAAENSQNLIEEIEYIGPFFEK